MSTTDELLRIVDHLISRGATALEVTHEGSSVKANLAPGGGTGLLPDAEQDPTTAEFEESLYYSAGKEGHK